MQEMEDAMLSPTSQKLQAQRPSATWKVAVAKVQSRALESDISAGFIGDKVNNVPSVIEQRSLPVPAVVPAQAPPRLAVMIHAARNLPGSASSSMNTSPRMYAKAALHMPGQLPLLADKRKTHTACTLDSAVVWNRLLSLAPQQPKEMMLTITLKQRLRFTNGTVVWGAVSIPLSDVLASPAEWGDRRSLQLQGHKLGGSGTAIEVQLFLSTERIQGPLRILAASWNVGNALPPPPEQLQDWLRGSAQSLHHLVVVGAQECNYSKDARAATKSMSRRASGKGRGSIGNGSEVLAAAAEAAIAAVAETPADSGAASLLPNLLEGTGSVRPGSSAASVFGSSKAGTTFCSEAGGPTDDLDMGGSDTADTSGAVGKRGPVGDAAAYQPTSTAAVTAAGHNSSRNGVGQQQFNRDKSSVGGVAAVEDKGAAGHLQPTTSGNTRTTQLGQYLLDQVDSATAWERLLAAALGSKYWLVASKHMFQTRILLFARVDVVPYISHIAAAYEATGLGRVGLNKGGVAVSLKLDDTQLAFVSSHLAAHQSKTAQRNADMSEICANIRLESPGQPAAAAGACLATGFHHLVWVGDLNYRLDYGQQAETFADSPSAEDFASLCARIHAGDYQQLLQHDQLRKEQAAGRVFAGFAEGDITFAPTFKVIKGEPGFKYAPKRSPAWCDRILFKSALPHKQGSCCDYFTVPDISTSDHKPVGAVLSLPLVTNTVTSASAAGRAPIKLYVASVKLSGQSTWERIAELAAKAGTAADIISSSGSYQSAPKSRRWRLVLSGACIAGQRQQHTLKVNHEAVAAGVAAAGDSAVLPSTNTAALDASITVREENLALLPGAVQDLRDDWVLLQLVLVEGFTKRTIARGIVPLQAAVQEYAARTFKAVQVPVQLECNGAVVGSASVSLQLISSQTARQGMYEAIRRMRILAMLRSSGHLGIETQRADSSTRLVSRTMSGTLLRYRDKVMEGIGMVRRANS